MSYPVTPEGRRIIFVDASSLKESACWRKFYWNSIVGYSGKGPVDFKMEYGTAWHKFLESYYSGEDVKLGMQKAVDYYMPVHDRLPEDEFRTIGHLMKSIEAYWRAYPFNKDGLKAARDNVSGKYSVEQKFAFPVWQNDNFVMMLSGTIDLVGEYYGQPCLADHKSTASYCNDKYFEEYEMGIQPMFYCYIDKLLNKRDRVLPFIINGIFIKKQTIKAMKDGVWDGVSFKRSRIIEFSEETMQQFEGWLDVKLKKIQQYLNSIVGVDAMELDFDLAACRTPFGICKYWNACKIPPTNRSLILESQFAIKPYNPLTFHGE